MKRLSIVFVLALTYLPLHVHAEIPMFEGTYSGSLVTKDKSIPIAVTLKQKGKEISGSYEYVKFHKPIELKGSVLDNSLVLGELDKNGKVVSLWEATHQEREGLKGTWRWTDKPSQGSVYSLVLTPSPNKKDEMSKSSKHSEEKEQVASTNKSFKTSQTTHDVKLISRNEESTLMSGVKAEITSHIHRVEEVNTTKKIFSSSKELLMCRYETKSKE